MSIIALEGVVEQGRIRLKSDMQLPEHTQVYVIVPDVQDAQIKQATHIYSPHLLYPEQEDDFKMEIVEGPANADLQ